MNYQIKLDMNMDANSLNTLLGALNSGPHGLMRGIIDNILAQAKEQEEAAKAAAEATPADIVEEAFATGGTD